jgi:hypothetical protein
MMTSEVSAVAAEVASVMTCCYARLSLPSITARPSAAEKARFATLAAASGVSESALAMIAIRKVLDADGTALRGSLPSPARGPATDRITIRLRPGDGKSITRRAAQRGMKPSTYLAALVRAHVAVNPPLTANELAALKQSVAVLAGVGRLLAQAIRLPSSPGLAREELQCTRAAVAALEQRTHDLARMALITWESRGA